MLDDVESLRVMWSHLEEMGTRMESSISSQPSWMHFAKAIQNQQSETASSRESLSPLGDPVHIDDFKVYDDHAMPYAQCFAKPSL